MGWVYARGISAAMVDSKFLWDIAIHQFISGAMGFCRALPSISIGHAFTDCVNAISTRILAASPKPTLSFYSAVPDLVPEAVYPIHTLILSRAYVLG